MDTIDRLDYDLLMQAYRDKCQECVNLQIVATKLKMQNEELTKEGDVKEENQK
ncbi:hypothetical protein GUI37_01705 [Helcococcus kunzii]|uniref:hypothetical protein n=1 Tax=Helcococcus kunzii TaxID=40091 RepID=UPI001BAFAA88|nr:hypothetical protein [Helcococcus kunzii]QUY64300.1 hypothetical protein GUI37_01705 [Helcococcus kunzii]